MARALWSEKRALGECFYFDNQEDCTTVVGVVEDASTGDLEEDAYLAYYLPLAQTSFAVEGLYVRASGDAHVLAAIT